MASQKSNTARALSALAATFLLIVCLQLVTVAISPASSAPIDTTNYKGKLVVDNTSLGASTLAHLAN